MTRKAASAAISDLQNMAQRHPPGGIFEYVARGIDEDRAPGANARAFDEVQFAPRAARNVSGVSPAVALLGKPTAAPSAVMFTT